MGTDANFGLPLELLGGRPGECWQHVAGGRCSSANLQLIRTRGNQSHREVYPARRTELASCGSDVGDIRVCVRETPCCRPGDRRLIESLARNPPSPGLSASGTKPRLKKDLGGIFFFFFLARAACGAVKWTSVPRQYILFQLPITPTTVACVFTRERMMAGGFCLSETAQQNVL